MDELGWPALQAILLSDGVRDLADMGIQESARSGDEFLAADCEAERDTVSDVRATSTFGPLNRSASVAGEVAKPSTWSEVYVREKRRSELRWRDSSCR